MDTGLKDVLLHTLVLVWRAWYAGLAGRLALGI